MSNGRAIDGGGARLRGPGNGSEMDPLGGTKDPAREGSHCTPRADDAKGELGGRGGHRGKATDSPCRASPGRERAEEPKCPLLWPSLGAPGGATLQQARGQPPRPGTMQVKKKKERKKVGSGLESKQKQGFQHPRELKLRPREVQLLA